MLDTASQIKYEIDSAQRGTYIKGGTINDLLTALDGLRHNLDAVTNSIEEYIESMED